MPKPVNETVGQCLCRRCRDRQADIRRFKNHERGARYLVCKKCGTDRVSGAVPQAALDEWIDSNGAESGPDVVPDTGPDISETVPDTENAGGLVPARPVPESGPGFLSQANEQLNEFFEG